MADVEWQPLPPLRPEPAVWTDVGEFMSLVFTRDGAPTTEISGRAKAGRQSHDLIANGTAGTFRGGKGSRTLQSKGAVLRVRCTVIQHNPRSVGSLPSTAGRFLSVIHKILTHNRHSGN